MEQEDFRENCKEIDCFDRTPIKERKKSPFVFDTLFSMANLRYIVDNEQHCMDHQKSNQKVIKKGRNKI